jgi:hypothetical protein
MPFDLLDDCHVDERTLHYPHGAFPPSSSDTFLIVAALSRIRMRPTSVKPVKVSFRTIRLAVSAAPTSGACGASQVKVEVFRSLGSRDPKELTILVKADLHFGDQ